VGGVLKQCLQPLAQEKSDDNIKAAARDVTSALGSDYIDFFEEKYRLIFYLESFAPFFDSQFCFQAFSLADREISLFRFPENCFLLAKNSLSIKAQKNIFKNRKKSQFWREKQQNFYYFFL